MKIEDFLMHQTDLKELAPGQTLFQEGESGDSMYVLIAGSANVLVKGKVVEAAGSGMILGELALIDDSPRAATVVATEACNLIAIDADRFRNLTREEPDFALHVMRTMAERLRRLGQLV